MPYINLGTSDQLVIKVPTVGSTGWADTLRTDTFLKIAQHNHTGSGTGSQLGTGSILADAITGAKIRLDNNEYIRARNAADSANINLIKVDANDDAWIDPELAKLNMKNDTYVTGRNNAGSADIDLIKVNTSDKIATGADFANLAITTNTNIQSRNNADSGYVSLIKSNTNDDIELGAEVAVLNVKNDTYITGRNQADSANVNLIKLDTSDKLIINPEINAVVKVANNTALQMRDQADSAYINIVKVNASDQVEIADTRMVLDGSVTLTDNTSTPATTGIITLASNEAAIVEYKIIRGTDVVSGILELEQSNANINREEIGDDVGVTFSLSGGALFYATTSTGNNATMSFNIVRK